MLDYTQAPEFAGPQGESNFGQAEPGQGGEKSTLVIAADPGRDPAAEAIERTIEAERQADMFRSAPPDATEIS